MIGISVEDGSAELLLDNDDVLTVPAELVQQAMPENTQDIEELTSDGTVTLEITRRGADVMTLIIKHKNVYAYKYENQKAPSGYLQRRKKEKTKKTMQSLYV